MSSQFNVTQKQAIVQYRKANKIGANVSDAQVLKQMAAKGKLPACFKSLSQPVGGAKSGKSNSVVSPKSGSNNELKALGLKNNKGAGTKVKAKDGKVYTVIGEAANGRRIVQDSKGQLEIIAHDGVLLKKSYVQKTPNGAKPKSASQTTLNSLRRNLNTAQKAFQKQLDDDGWAGDLADGVSALWGSKNRASKVRKDIASEQYRLNQLSVAAQKGDASFKAKFKQLYGVDYNQAAIDNYNKKPTAANYKKAYGSKYPDIRARVNEYNKSQQTGAEAVKTTAKVAGGVAVGVATGGTGLVAVGLTAAATTAASVAIEESDRYKITSGGGFRKGTNHKKILKSALWDGASVAAGGAVGKVATKVVAGTTKAAIAGRAAINVAGDVSVGAAQEYAETGKVTATGVISNAAMSGVGSAVSSGAFKGLKGKISRTFKKKTTAPNVARSAKPKVKTTTSQATSHKVGTSRTGKKVSSSSTAGIEIVSRNSHKGAGIEIVSKKATGNVKPKDANVLGSKFMDLSDSGVKIKQSESGTILVRDKVGNEYHTTVDVGETRPIITDASGNKISVTRDKNGDVRIVNEKAPNKTTTPKNMDTKVPETKVETHSQTKSVTNDASRKPVSQNVEAQNHKELKSSASTQKLNVESKPETVNSKTTSNVEAKQQKAEQKAKSMPQTLDDVYDAMDNIVQKQGARRKEVVKPFDTKIEDLKSQQVKLKTDFETYKKSTKAKVAELQASNDKIMAEIKGFESVSREFPQRANILNRKISQYRMALDDLEKAYNTYQKTNGNHGGSVRELDEFTHVLRDKTQGGVISYHSDSMNAIGKGDLPIYEHSEEIGDLFHNYNISKDKASVVAEMRTKLTSLEQQSGQLNSVIQSNNKSLAGLKQKHSENSKLMSQLDNDVKAREDELSKASKQNSVDIEELEQNRGKALDELKNTHEYKALNADYKSLQQKARELSK